MMNLENIKEANRIAILEILLNPEHDREWLLEVANRAIEVAEPNDESANEEDVDALEDMVLATLKELAIPVLATLKSEDDREIYFKLIEAP